VGFFACPDIYGPFESVTVNYHPGVFYSGQDRQLATQAYGVSVTVLYSAVVTWVLLVLVDVTVGLVRVSMDDDGSSMDEMSERSD
jgi:Amt family ammonium transporter